jgi:hypothetical protein
MRANMRSLFHRGLPVLLLLGSFALAGPAAAQDVAAADAIVNSAAAEALFNKGLAELEAGRHRAGCPAIAESLRLDPRPGTLFTLATCEDRWGHVATALARYDEYLAVYERLPDDKKARQGERPKVAKAQRDKLAAEVPTLTLSLPTSAPPGTVVKRDGQVVAAAALGTAIPVDPGEYTVSTQAPNGQVWEQRITIGRGEKKNVVLEWRGAPAVERETGSTPPPERKGGPTVERETGSTPPPERKGGPTVERETGSTPLPDRAGVPTWAWISGGAGLALLGVGAGFGVGALKANASVTSTCGGDAAHCPESKATQAAPFVSARRVDRGVFIGLTAGGVVGIVAGVVGIAKARASKRSAQEAVSLAPFVSPAGSGFSAHGVW